MRSVLPPILTSDFFFYYTNSFLIYLSFLLSFWHLISCDYLLLAPLWLLHLLRPLCADWSFGSFQIYSVFGAVRLNPHFREVITEGGREIKMWTPSCSGPQLEMLCYFGRRQSSSAKKSTKSSRARHLLTASGSSSVLFPFFKNKTQRDCACSAYPNC